MEGMFIESWGGLTVEGWDVKSPGGSGFDKHPTETTI